MRNPTDLSRHQLIAIVRSIQQWMYVDLDRDGSEFWNPDKTWQGAEFCEHVAGLLGDYELIPASRRPITAPLLGTESAARYVLYDYDGCDLASPVVYHQPDEATRDADQFSNVIVLRLNVPAPIETPLPDEEESCV